MTKTEDRRVSRGNPCPAGWRVTLVVVELRLATPALLVRLERAAMSHQALEERADVATRANKYSP